MNPKTVKKALKDAIQAMTDYKWLFSARSGKDNTRNRKFPFQKVIPFILAFRGGTLNHEIMDFFGLDPSTGTSSALGMIFWILPVVSLFTNGIMYRTAFGKEFDLAVFVPALLGVMFIFIGNYLFSSAGVEGSHRTGKCMYIKAWRTKRNFTGNSRPRCGRGREGPCFGV